MKNYLFLIVVVCFFTKPIFSAENVSKKTGHRGEIPWPCGVTLKFSSKDKSRSEDVSIICHRDGTFNYVSKVDSTDQWGESEVQTSRVKGTWTGNKEVGLTLEGMENFESSTYKYSYDSSDEESFSKRVPERPVIMNFSATDLQLFTTIYDD